MSSKDCGEKMQPQINANERKSIQEKSTRMTPSLGVFSDVHLKSAKSWVLGFLESVYEKALYVELAEREP